MEGDNKRVRENKINLGQGDQSELFLVAAVHPPASQPQSTDVGVSGSRIREGSEGEVEAGHGRDIRCHQPQDTCIGGVREKNKERESGAGERWPRARYQGTLEGVSGRRRRERKRGREERGHGPRHQGTSVSMSLLLPLLCVVEGVEDKGLWKEGRDKGDSYYYHPK